MIASAALLTVGVLTLLCRRHAAEILRKRPDVTDPLGRLALRSGLTPQPADTNVTLLNRIIATGYCSAQDLVPAAAELDEAVYGVGDPATAANNVENVVFRQPAGKQRSPRRSSPRF